MYIPYKKTAVVEIPKCAARSLRSAISSAFAVTSIGHGTLAQYKKAHPELLRASAVIREPLARLKSAVQHKFEALGPEPNLSEVRAGLLEIKTGLVAAAEKSQKFSDVTFYPQYSFLMCSSPVTLYSMDAIPNLLFDLAIESVDHLKVEGKSKIDLPLEEIIALLGEDFVSSFYGVDFALHKNLSSLASGVMRVDDARGYVYSLR